MKRASLSLLLNNRPESWLSCVRERVNMEKSIVVLFLVRVMFSPLILLGFLGSCAIAQWQPSCAFVCPLLFDGGFLCLFLASQFAFAPFVPQHGALPHGSSTKVQLRFSSSTIPEGPTFTTFQFFRVRIDSRQIRIHVKSRSHYLSLLRKREQHPSVSEKQHLDSRFIKYCFI